MSKEEGKIKSSYRIDPQTLVGVQRKANELNISKGQLVRDALHQYLKQSK